jgi:hypothetical protein
VRHAANATTISIYLSVARRQLWQLTKKNPVALGVMVIFVRSK